MGAFCSERLLPKGVSEASIPTWITNENNVWFCNPVTLLKNLLANPDFEDKFNYMPYQECTEDTSVISCQAIGPGNKWFVYLSSI